ncbi:hypothetical protein [Vannielia litorea]|uniref:hypothetical protein n=1 Tax=Vannielia litorea TaxID=1217970 RepID=UPI001BCCF140|nr:hypothetical protein [Vannielia litorea]
MDLFARLFDTEAHTLACGTAGESTLQAPAPELSAPPVALSELLCEDGSVLTGFLEAYAARYAPELAGDFRELARMVREGEGQHILRGQPKRNTLDFVYPVV